MKESASTLLAERHAADRHPLNRIWGGLFLGWTASVPLMVGTHLRFLHRYSLPLADVIFVAAFAAFLVSLVSRAQMLRACTWYRPLAAYAIALGLSTLMAENVRRSLPKLAGDLYLIAAAILTINYVTDLQTLRRTMFAWLAGMLMTTVGGLAGLAMFLGGVTSRQWNPFLSRFGSLPPGHYPRIQSIFLNPNMMCSYMVAAIMILIAARQAGWISGTACRLMLAGGLVVAAFSISPGLGGLCLAIGLWQASLQPQRLTARVIAGSGILIAFLVFAGAPVSFTHLANAPLIDTILHPAASGRLMTWTGAWHTFVTHPLLGQGLESDAARVHYLTASGQLQTLTDAHNTWLSIMAQQGVVGLLAFLWLVLHLVRRFRLWTGPLNRTAGVRVTIELAFLGAFLYVTLGGSFENTRHVWALMGLVAAIQQLPDLPDVTAG